MKWRIVQVSPDNFRVEYRYLLWPFWFLSCRRAHLVTARESMEFEIMSRHTYPRVVEQISDEVAFVRARLKQ